MKLQVEVEAVFAVEETSRETERLRDNLKNLEKLKKITENVRKIKENIKKIKKNYKKSKKIRSGSSGLSLSQSFSASRPKSGPRLALLFKSISIFRKF